MGRQRRTMKRILGSFPTLLTELTTLPAAPLGKELPGLEFEPGLADPESVPLTDPGRHRGDLHHAGVVRHHIRSVYSMVGGQRRERKRGPFESRPKRPPQWCPQWRR